MTDQTLYINEIFHSIQGESTWSGLPCSFVRLRGCALRCHYCDSSYAFTEGEKVSIEEIMARLDEMNTNLVQITGGEPLLQQDVHILMGRLLDMGYQVLIETSGDRDISVCDARVNRIIDIKTPNSGAADSFLESNYAYLTDIDEVKFVITNKEDFDWAINVVHAHGLLHTVRAVHFSPVMEQAGDQYIEGVTSLDPIVLSDWILESNVPVRMHLQVHKYIWPPQTRGV